MIYLAGFIQTTNPKVLINPQPFTSVTGLFEWLTGFLNSEDFAVSKEITLPGLMLALADDQALTRIDFIGYDIAILMGSQLSIVNSTDRFVYADFDYKKPSAV